MLNILMTGDVVGESGRRAVARLLPDLRREYKLDLVIVNGENADGLGLYINSARELFKAGADIITLGDHIYDKSEIYDYLPLEPRIVRPLNFNPATPGYDRAVVQVGSARVMVVSVIGELKINIYTAASPFAAMDQLFSEIETLPEDEKPNVILVDFHAEDFKEKHTLGWYLDGRISGIVGTHTHVPTLDARVLPNGTGKVTDLGMCGPHNSSLGMSIEAALTRFVEGMPSMYELASGPVQFNSAVFHIDETSGRCLGVERVDRLIEFNGDQHIVTFSSPATARTDSQALS